MAFSAFDDKTREPVEDELAAVLGQSVELWNRLVADVNSEFNPLAKDWTYSGKKWGWALRLKHKKRAVLYLTPSEGFFYAGFALGQKAVDAAHGSGLSSSVLAVIDSSQKYAEGRAVRLEVRSEEDVRDVVQLASIKMGN